MKKRPPLSAAALAVLAMLPGTLASPAVAAQRKNPEREVFFGYPTRITTPLAWMAGKVFAGLDVRLENPAGLTGLWADENTRTALFESIVKGWTKVVTTVGDLPFDLTVDKLQDKDVGARRNELGYANYELIPPPADLAKPGEQKVIPF